MSHDLKLDEIISAKKEELDQEISKGLPPDSDKEDSLTSALS